MRQIYALHLGSNQLASTIPTELGSLQQLQVLELHSNLLTGTIPVALNKLRLRGLQLQNNERDRPNPGIAVLRIWTLREEILLLSTKRIQPHQPLHMPASTELQSVRGGGTDVPNTATHARHVQLQRNGRPVRARPRGLAVPGRVHCHL